MDEKNNRLENRPAGIDQGDASGGGETDIAPDDDDHGRIGYGTYAKFSPALLGLAIVALVAFIGWREWRPNDDLPRTGDLIDQPAPAFTLTLFDGSAISSQDLMGMPVALNFWASWCAPCKTEMPAFEAAFAALAASGTDAAIVGIGIKNDYEPNAVDLLEELNITYPTGRDTGGSDPQRGEIEQAFGVTTYPATVFLRPDGTVSAVRFGEMDEAEIMDYLRAATEPG